MAEPKIRFRYHEPDIDTNRPLVDGQVKIDGFELEVLPWDAEDYDAWDAGATSLPPTVVSGDIDISIPAYPNRKFRLGYIFVNEAAGIEQPGGLEGKRVGLAAWSNPAGVWAKGALQNYYEVDLTKISWFAPGADPKSAPEGITLQSVANRKDLDPMLVSGELDAVIEPNVLPCITKRDPRVRRLFRDYKSEEQKYWRETGIFPISHIVTLKRQFVERNPTAPLALLKAFREARDVAFNRVIGSDPEYLIMSWASAAIDEQRAVMGDNYWSYNVADNRPSLDAVSLFSHQQGLTPYKVDYQQFFDPEAAALPGY
jgi:4,5-dihydroxyphthalate decarboxylase